MAQDVQINILGLPGVRRKIVRLQGSIFSRSMMVEIGEYILTAIKVRTVHQGRDVSGKLFKPYSEGYKLFRKKHGHPVNKVDLTFTGAMFISMTFDAVDDKVEVFFRNTQDEKGVSNPKKAFFLNEERRFFALSTKEIDVIKNIVREHYRRLING